MIKKEIKYTYRDLTIVPEKLSMINSRSECNVFYENGMLPIWTAPMIPIVDKNNAKFFRKNGINTIIPRTNDLQELINNMNSSEWVAMSLKQFEDLFLKNDNNNLSKKIVYNICIDIANAHMNKLYTIIGDVAESYGVDNLNIMIGNIANPETYRWICDNMPDMIKYVRVGIGCGAGCTTTSNTGVHYPMASLVNECYNIKRFYNDAPKIIADGGIRGYADVVKALALGADYVMIGGLFASILESAGEIEDLNKCLVKQRDNVYAYKFSEKLITTFNMLSDAEETKRDIIRCGGLMREFYGMSTKKAQAIIKHPNDKLKTSEGRVFNKEITYTLEQWVDNMKSYLRSAMSYCGVDNLSYFIGQPTLIVNSTLSINAVNK